MGRWSNVRLVTLNGMIHEPLAQLVERDAGRARSVGQQRELRETRNCVHLEQPGRAGRVDDDVDPSHPRAAERRERASRGVACGFARSLATIAFDKSIPCTGTPRCPSGSAIRPVPIPSSSARPLPASSTRRSITGSMSPASNSTSVDSSYLAATRSSK